MKNGGRKMKIWKKGKNNHTLLGYADAVEIDDEGDVILTNPDLQK